MSTEQFTSPESSIDDSAAPVDRKLRVLRVLWLASFVLIVSLYLLGILFYYNQMLAAPSAPNQGVADPGLPAILAEAGISAPAYAVYKLIVGLGNLPLVVVAAIIFWRRNYDRSAVVMSYLLLLAAGAGPMSGAVLAEAGSAGVWLDGVLTWVGAGAVTLLFFLFPSGRFEPRWTRWVALFFLAFTLPPSLAPGSPYDVLFQTLLAPVVFFPLLGCFIYAQVYRYRRVSGSVERLQTRWAMLGLLAWPVAWAISALLGWLAPTLFQGSADTIAQSILLDLLLLQPLYLLFPIGLGIAILRYRLYDIDVIIRKTLVYSVLTVLLGLVYFGSVVLLQRLVGSLTGVAQSPLAVVVSTLVIAALFTPLRRRIQDVIDRRFYRKKYDAQQVLARFAVTARDETDLDALTAELVHAAQETLQPESVSVWLKYTPTRKL